MNDDDKTITNADEESQMNENNEMVESVDTQEESMENTSVTPATTDNDWVKVSDGKFICSECENEIAPETNTVDGTVTADTDKILGDLKEFPSKIVYGSCPVCGMEYTFKAKDGELYMEPSDMIK